jgi:choline dehydrogenase-like flavoprotein
MDSTYLKHAKDNGVLLHSNSKIIKLLIEGSKCIGAVVKFNNSYHKVYGDNFFLSAGAIQTPILLRNSGIKKNIGNNLSLHLNLRFLVMYDHELNSNKATIFTHQVQEFEKEGILIQATNFAKPWVYSALESKYPIDEFDIKNFYTNGALYTAQIRPKATGKVRSFGTYATFCFYNLLDEDIELIKKAITLSCRIFFESGATHIYLPILGSKPIYDITELNNIFLNKKFRNKLELISVHAMSSCPMGSGINAAVDFDGKLLGYDNIYISDSSVLPTNIGESPQGTIMYFAHHIANQFVEKNSN